MIRMRCPSCDAKLKMPEHFAGRKGKCPNCKAKVLFPERASDADIAQLLAEVASASLADAHAALDPIPFDSLPRQQLPAAHIVHSGDRSGPADDASAIDDHHPPAGSSSPSLLAESLDPHDPDYVPTHLGKLNHYLVCDSKDVVARWHPDDRGWMLRQKNGFTRVALVENDIPCFGQFVLIEIGVARSDDGFYLRHVNAFRLQQHFALATLLKDEDSILHTIVGPAELNQRQRKHVRDLVKEMFLPRIWEQMLRHLT